jgi:intracellular septation protein
VTGLVQDNDLMTTFLLDFLPLLAFYGAFWLGGIYVATGVGILASAMSIAWALGRRHPIRPMAWISFGLIVVFGGATLILHDETFIKWKPTVLYWLFASVLWIGPRLLGKNPIAMLLGKELHLSEAIWTKVNNSWAVLFSLLGVLNLVIAYNFDTTTWATFKVFGTMAIMVVFLIVQGIFLAPHMQNEKK